MLPENDYHFWGGWALKHCFLQWFLHISPESDHHFWGDELSNTVFYNDFCTFYRKKITIFGGLSSQTLFFTMICAHFVGKWSPFFEGFELLGVLLAPRWPRRRSGPPVKLHLEVSWSLCWRQDGPSGAKMGQVRTELAVKFGKLRTKRRILYIYKLPIHRIHAAG